MTGFEKCHLHGLGGRHVLVSALQIVCTCRCKLGVQFILSLGGQTLTHDIVSNPRSNYVIVSLR